MELAGSHTVVGKVILEPCGGPGVPCPENPGAVRPPFGQAHVMKDGAGSEGAAGQPAVLERVLPQIGGMVTVERLAALSGSDFTSVMLEVTRRRAARETPASVRRRYASDRFTQPGRTPWRSIRQAEDALLGCLPPDVEMLTLAPVVPLGTHSGLATVSQHEVLSTIRACEVAADPTNALALEAAGRRRALPRTATVKLAGIQRVVRAQQFQGAGAPAHFTLFGLVTAGRDEGSYGFERAALAEHLRFTVAGVAVTGLRHIHVALTPLSDAGEQIAAAVIGELDQDRGPAAAAVIVLDHARQRGRGYYRDLCFKVHAHVRGELAEIADGGFTDWTRRLAASSKERLLISGIGLDRLAMFAAAASWRGGPHPFRAGS